MPRLIPKDEAVAQITRELGGRACVMCALAQQAGPPATIARGQWSKVIASRYPRAWGHLLVVLDAHVTRFSDLSAPQWAEATELARLAARLLERLEEPARCYVASLGAGRVGIPMSSPHLHLHVIPVDDPDVSPARMLSWDDGVWAAEPQEWEALFERLRHGWAQDRSASGVSGDA